MKNFVHNLHRHRRPDELEDFLAEVERRVVATVVQAPGAAKRLLAKKCVWCLFADPRHAYLVVRTLHTHQSGNRPQTLSLVNWVCWSGGGGRGVAQEYLGRLLLEEPVENLARELATLHRALAHCESATN